MTKIKDITKENLESETHFNNANFQSTVIKLLQIIAFHLMKK